MTWLYHLFVWLWLIILALWVSVSLLIKVIIVPTSDLFRWKQFFLVYLIWKENKKYISFFWSSLIPLSGKCKWKPQRGVKKKQWVLVRLWRNWNPVHCWWQSKMVKLLWKIVWQFLKKVNIKLLYGLTAALLSINTKEVKTGFQAKSCTPKFITFLFTVAKSGGNLYIYEQMNGST